MSLVSRHFFDGNHATAKLIEQAHHLSQYTFTLSETKIIGKHNAERLITDHRPPGQDCVAEALHLNLSGVGKRTQLDQFTNAFKRLLFTGAGNLVFELITDVKMIFYRAFASASDEADIGQPGRQRLLDTVLHQGFVQYRQNFLGHCLGRR